MSLYNAKSSPDGIRITKFTDDLEIEETKGVQSSYIVSGDACDCPAGHRDSCRHRKMLPLFQATNRVDSKWMYDFDNERWYILHEMRGLEEQPSWRRV